MSKDFAKSILDAVVDENEARQVNARLTAAAPELWSKNNPLERLEETRRWLSKVTVQSDSQHWTVGRALSRHVGIPRTTLQSAVTQGRIPSRTFGCGTMIVYIGDVQQWAKSYTPKSK